MVEKISINIKVISLNVEHNFLIPCEMSVADATELIVQTLREEYHGVKKNPTNGHVLLQASSGKMLNQTCSFRQLEIVQGERLILI